LTQVCPAQDAETTTGVPSGNSARETVAGNR